ncbi:MAG: ParB family chromosome partitioning protein, partial [Gammaproteobacteria bacterium]
MARKDMMKGLMNDTPPSPAARVDAAKPRYGKGAIGAVSRSIEDLKRRSIQEIDARMIDAAGLKDRLDIDDADLAMLMASIETYGQQVPVLLRVNPNDPERYQIVYGRRRVAALKALGQPIKALIRDLDDKALILAQGQENTARKDLTFIEKANFARQMRDAGYDRKIMGDALAMDKTLVSRLLSVADKVPVQLIEAIGSAPNVGRDRWLALADKLGESDLVAQAVGDTSDMRFNAVMTALKSPKPAIPAKTTLVGGATVTRSATKTVVTLD